MNDVILVPTNETNESAPLQLSKTSEVKEAVLTPVEKKLPEQSKNVPTGKWLMPPEQHGYIQANDRDCL